MSAPADREGLERNLRLLPRFTFLRSLLFWLPVFFLYFQRELPSERVLHLAALYYFGTVLFEVPSGYLSDRVGRRITLSLAVLANLAGAALFLSTSSFGSFAVAQLLFAASTAFISGTDTSLLFDSLRGLGRTEEHPAAEGRMQSASFLGLALGSLSGGALAGFDLRLAYVLTALASAGALAVSLRFREPARPMASDLWRQLRACVDQLRDPVLAWVFVFAVGMFSLNHVPFEFLQPWVGHLLGGGVRSWDPTPAMAGAVLGATMLVSAWASKRAAGLRLRLGTAATLLAACALQGVVILGMGLAVHACVLPLLAMRSIPQALGVPVTRAEIHPRIPSELRATYLSMQSLAGRVLFTVALFACSTSVGESAHLSPGELAGILRAFAVSAALLWLGLLLGRRALRAA